MSAAPVNTRTAWKILASVVVVTSAVSGLLYASMKDGVEYYKFVHEVLASPQAFKDKRIRVHGHAAEVEKQKGTLVYRFKIATPPDKQPGGHIIAHYRGLAPDTFKDGNEVVATGVLGANNELYADKLEAKCPSKYDAKDPQVQGTLGAAAPAAAKY